MPGVPSSRGCEACRKQKKKVRFNLPCTPEALAKHNCMKCDQLKPSCSRCARLQITCEGSGQRRYKFKEQSLVLRPTESQQAQRRVITVGRGPSLVPGNDHTLVVSGFLSALKVVDLRYDLTYYGGFIRDIPRRLGTNDALDASVSAMVSAFPSLYTNQQSPEMLENYGHALKTLRVTLCDPAKAYTPNTLCAIYLLEVCQSWLGSPDNPLAGYGEVLAHFLNAATLEESHDNFEIEMLITICAAVVCESLVNPKIQLKTFFTNFEVTLGQTKYGPCKHPHSSESGPIDSIKLQNIARIGDFFRDPKSHISEIRSVYQQLLVDFQKIRRRLALSKESTSTIRNPLQSYLKAKELTCYQAASGIICTLALVMCCILRIFYPRDRDLVEDSKRLCNDVLRLAESASQYRPLGSAYMPFCLMAAWVAMDGTPMQLEVEAVLQDWKTDFRNPKWRNMAIWLKNNLEDLRLKISISELDIFSDNIYDLTRAMQNELGY